VPVSHLSRLEKAAARSRAEDPEAGRVEALIIPGGQHSWLYEYAAYRGTVARFFAAALDGPLDPAAAEAAARATNATRLPQREHPFSAIEEEPGGFRTLARAIRQAGASRREATPAGSGEPQP
jgi:hypothetical protein